MMVKLQTFVFLFLVSWRVKKLAWLSSRAADSITFNHGTRDMPKHIEKAFSTEFSALFKQPFAEVAFVGWRFAVHTWTALVWCWWCCNIHHDQTKALITSLSRVFDCLIERLENLRHVIIETSRPNLLFYCRAFYIIDKRRSKVFVCSTSSRFVSDCDSSFLLALWMSNFRRLKSWRCRCGVNLMGSAYWLDYLCILINVSAWVERLKHSIPCTFREGLLISFIDMLFVNSRLCRPASDSYLNFMAINLYVAFSKTQQTQQSSRRQSEQKQKH